MYSRITASSRHSVETEYPGAQKCWPKELRFHSPLLPRQVDSSLPLDEPDHLRHRVLRRVRQKNVNVIGHQVPFFDQAFLPRRQLAEHLARVLSQLRIQRSPSAFRDEDDVKFAVPWRVAQTFELVHLDTSFRVLVGSRLEVSTVDNPLKSQTPTASPEEPGSLSLQLESMFHCFLAFMTVLIVAHCLLAFLLTHSKQREFRHADGQVLLQSG